MSAITTHILDISRGQPAAGVAVTLEVESAAAWTSIGGGITNQDGRISGLAPAESGLAAGVYRLTFATGEYFSKRGLDSFYPQVVVVFRIADPAQHYHVPLLVSPFGYSTYRGS